MQTNDAGLLFRTDNDLKDDERIRLKAKSAGNVGSPIQVTSQILRVHIVDNVAWTAESGWQARRIDLVSGRTQRLYRGHQGPVTDVTSFIEKSGRRILLTASWDKTIRLWDAESAHLLHVLSGHADFVKSITIIPATNCRLLLSTSSDRTLRLWRIGDLTSSPECIKIIKSHSRPVERCAWRRIVAEASPKIYVWTGDSLGMIKRWELSGEDLVLEEESRVHETSVSDLVVTDEAVLSASMDKTATLKSFLPGQPTVLSHDCYVHAACALTTQPLLITGGEDEAIRVWDANDAEEGIARLVSTVEGHVGSVTTLSEWTSSREYVLVSGSLDGTLRRWTLEDLLNPKPLDVPVPDKNIELTEDEERELAELMDE